MGPALNLLLDSATLIWATSRPSLLSDAARTAIASIDNEVFVSAASAWEISTKHRLGRLEHASVLVGAWKTELEQNRYVPLAITDDHALHAGGYDVEHGDPFDRIIAAQAELENLTLVASNRAFDLFPVRRLW